MGIIGVIIWLIGVINLLTKSHDPPSRSLSPRILSSWVCVRVSDQNIKASYCPWEAGLHKGRTRSSGFRA